MAETKKNVTECAIAVAEAREKHSEIRGRKDAIDRELTAATNALNAATKAFDAAVQAFKIDAPWGTDWHSQNNPPHRVEAA